MGVLDDLGSLASQFAGGRVSETEVHDAYDRTAREAPREAVAEGLTEAFRSDQTPPFEQMVSGLYDRSNPQQKAGLLNQMIAALGAGGLTEALSRGGLGSLTNILRGGRATPEAVTPEVVTPEVITPEVAAQVPPQEVEVLARRTARKDPTIMEKAADFYAQHPTLVKTIGAGALALLMSRMSRARR